jgi:Na+/proline symporter
MSIGAIALMVTLVTAAVFSLVGIVSASRQRINLEDYMVSRNRFGGWMAFATVVASTMGAWILFSPPEVGATSGIAGIAGYCIGQAVPSLGFVWIGPRIRQLMPRGHSLNEYVLYRFGNAMYGLTLAIIAFYMLVYLVAELTAIAKAVNILADVPLGWTALVVITATFIYTTYGGLGATIFTDAIQFLIITPLLLIILAIAVGNLGGLSPALEPVRLNAPELLSFTNGPAIKFGLTLVIAIISAEMFNQGNWQRVYACRTDNTVRRSFLASGLVILPMLCISGLLGLLAMHFGFNSDIAFFSLLQALAIPLWAIVLVLVLALALVMSSLDSLLNGIISVLIIDLRRLFPRSNESGLLRLSRGLTVAVSVPVVLIAAQGYNVLYLFLLADLVCAGALFPVLYGLYNRHITGTMAVTSSAVGIAVGALFFPKPDFTPWTTIPFAGDLLVSFAAPVVVSVGMVLIWSAIAPQSRSELFDFEQLQTRITAYSEVSVVDDR